MNMDIQGVGKQHHHHGGGIDGFIQKLQNDNSDEANGVKTAYAKLQDDIKAGASQDDLKADRSALTDAMKAYREKNPPPQRAEHGGGQNFLQKLADKVANDNSAEGTQLAAAIKKLQDDASGLDNDKQSFMDALKAYFQKQQASAGGDAAQGQMIDCQA